MISPWLTLFYQDVKKGDFVKIYGNNKDGGYVFKYRVVKSVISNTILSLTENVDLILDNLDGNINLFEKEPSLRLGVGSTIKVIFVSLIRIFMSVSYLKLLYILNK